MIILSPQELRRLTDTALAESKKRVRQEQAAATEKAELENRINQLEAEKIILQIPERSAFEANQGRSHAVVMGLESDRDYPQNFIGESESWQTLLPLQLIGPELLVYQNCVDAGLNPTLEYWHDGLGIKSGFNIVIHW